MKATTGKEHAQRAKAMCRTIRIAWSSLKSHLQYAVHADPSDCGNNADEVFHAQAIVEYSQQIAICAKELKHINVERAKIVEKKTLSESRTYDNLHTHEGKP